MKNHCNNGFTLIELLVVIFIVSIMTTITIVSFGDFGAKRREKITLWQFANVIQFLQKKAILQSTVITMKIYSQGYSIDHESHPKAFHLFSFVSVKTQTNHPVVLFLPNGKMTSFTLTVKGKYKWKMSVMSNANINILLL